MFAAYAYIGVWIGREGENTFLLLTNFFHPVKPRPSESAPTRWNFNYDSVYDRYLAQAA